jgi:hypothetical protein
MSQVSGLQYFTNGVSEFLRRHANQELIAMAHFEASCPWRGGHHRNAVSEGLKKFYASSSARVQGGDDDG